MSSTRHHIHFAAVLVAVFTVVAVGTVAGPASGAEPARITGTVTGIQPDPDYGLTVALVTVYPADDPTQAVAFSFLTGGSDDFELELAPGSYIVSARTEARATEWWSEATTPGGATPVTIAPGEEVELSFVLDTPALSFTLDDADPPGFSGLGTSGTIFTADPGTLSPAPDSIDFQWALNSSQLLSDTVLLAGETDPTITIPEESRSCSSR